jgi:hypothetical protein
MLSQKLSFHLCFAQQQQQHISLLQVPHIFEFFENKLEPGIDYLHRSGCELKNTEEETNVEGSEWIHQQWKGEKP